MRCRKFGLIHWEYSGETSHVLGDMGTLHQRKGFMTRIYSLSGMEKGTNTRGLRNCAYSRHPCLARGITDGLRAIKRLHPWTEGFGTLGWVVSAEPNPNMR